MLDEREGWFVVNVAEARWKEHAAFGRRCSFEMEGPFEQVGINLAVLRPGRPNCRYHRETGQEDFLVLSGECLLLANDQERRLKAWDFVHCPPGTTHVFVGQGDGPCVILMIGHRGNEKRIFYPENDRARAHGASALKATSEPREAYADVGPFKEIPPPAWPPA